jgi:hypothetical protein
MGGFRKSGISSVTTLETSRGSLQVFALSANYFRIGGDTPTKPSRALVDRHGVPGTPHPLTPWKRTGFRRDSRLLQRSQGSPFSHRRGSSTLVQYGRQPLISPTLGSYFAEAGIALAKSAHVTTMKFCSFRNFLNSSLLTRSISFWRHCAPQSGWSNVAARISSLS